MKGLMTCSLLLTLVACQGKSGSGSPSVYTGTFSDTAVSSFEQTGGLAKYKPSAFEMVIPSAYAAEGSIRCVQNTPVTFDVIALGANLQIEANCDNNIDLSIRKDLLRSLAGKRLLMNRGGGADAKPLLRVINFRPDATFWGIYDNVVAGHSNNGQNEQNCRDKFTFDEATGTVTIAYDNLASTADTHQACLDNEFPGATEDDYKIVLAFRFKNGLLEMDPEGTDFEDNGDYINFCIDDNSDSQCD